MPIPKLQVHLDTEGQAAQKLPQVQAEVGYDREDTNMIERLEAILDELKAQQARVVAAIAALNGGAKKRGRPPGTKNRKRRAKK
jgi:hypothetical protein